MIFLWRWYYLSSLTFNMKDLENGIDSFMGKSEAAIKMYAETSALKLQNYAREKRPWTDRTGHARQRLSGYSGKVAKGYKLYLAHGVDYGLWLELAHEKRFSIIPQTLQHVGSKTIMPGFERLMEKLK